MQHEENKNQINLDDYQNIIKQLPAELQERILIPHSNCFMLFRDTLENSKLLSGNLRELVIEHQRISKLDWDDDDFQDFYILLDFLLEMDDE